jgi:hypothetical protein
MMNNRWVGSSRNIYAALLNLYPKAYRGEYGPDMLQVFTDECRACFREGKGFGLLPLWLRTLGDLVVTVFKEHLSDPHSAVGLMEAAPNSPLPWKGVALVLLPGLIFFVSQVAQLTGKDWFFLLVYRGAYVLILPVLIVWIWKRRFPIWGLVPLGLLFKTLSSLIWAQSQALPLNLSTPALLWWNVHNKAWFCQFLQISISLTILLSIIGLLWLVKKRSGITRAGWIWLGVFCLLCVSSLFAKGVDVTLDEEFMGYILNGMLVLAYTTFYSQGSFLVMVLLGALLAKRHGRLAVLLPLGFLLPTIVYGRIYDIWPLASEPGFGLMALVAAAALIYRFMVALAAPLWIVRSANGKKQNRAWIVSMLTLMGIQLAFTIALIFVDRSVVQPSNYYVASAVFEQLIIGAGLALAIVLYGKAPSPQNVEPEMGNPPSPEKVELHRRAE